MADSEVARLVAAAVSGDDAAWREIVYRYVDLVWAVARAHGLSDCDSADVSQTTWLRLTEHLDRLHEPDRVGAWLATTARRESLKVIRERRREVPRAFDGSGAGEGATSAGVVPGPDDLAERADPVLAEAFALLTPPCQRLLRTLVSDPAPTYAEVSAALDMPIGSIGPNRARCLDRLRRHLLTLSAGSRSAPRQNVTAVRPNREREVS